VRAAARAARDAGVRVRELAPEELTDEMRHKLQHDVSGGLGTLAAAAAATAQPVILSARKLCKPL
jgi:hypothetical protein